MKVTKLIEKLQKLPEDSDVLTVLIIKDEAYITV